MDFAGDINPASRRNNKTILINIFANYCTRKIKLGGIIKTIFLMVVPLF